MSALRRKDLGAERSIGRAREGGGGGGATNFPSQQTHAHT